MKRILPFKLKQAPIKKLLLINFGKNPDSVYEAFELQYIDSKPTGTGYRVLAWRTDKSIDVYDDMNLQYLPDENFNVAGNGLHKHIQTDIEKVSFENKNGNECISFKFKDLQGRVIDFSIIERLNFKSKALNLLAPVGRSSKKPEYLPAFFLYDFHFIRRRKTETNCFIDNKKIELDTFPLPLNGKFCYYSRFSENCTLLEFINTDYKIIEEVELNEHLRFSDGNIDYNFDNDGLNTIVIHVDNSKIHVKFIPSLKLENSTGEFSIQPNEKMGNIEGIYSVETQNKKITICIKPVYGWNPVPNSFISKMMFSKKSIFRNWSKNYELQQILHLDTKEVSGKWTNNNFKERTN